MCIIWKSMKYNVIWNKMKISENEKDNQRKIWKYSSLYSYKNQYHEINMFNRNPTQKSNNHDAKMNR